LLAIIAVAAIGTVAITARLVLTRLIIAVLILTRLITLFLALILTLVLTLLLTGLGPVGGFTTVLSLTLILTIFVFEIDIKPGRNRITAQNFCRGPMRLNRPQDPEIVFSVLQIILCQHPIARRRGVAGQLLVLFEDVLSMAPNLDPIGAIGFKRPIGVLLRLTAAIAALGSPGSTTATLPLHSFEISHVLFGDLVRQTPNGRGVVRGVLG
jgi:hypothetical protein